MIHVKQLSQQEDFERYADFAQEVYAGNSYWVPPHRDHLIQEVSGRVAQAEYSDIQAFWVERNGKILATVTAVVDRLYIKHWREPLGHLFFFEALAGCDDEVRALFDAACGWLGEKGCRAARFEFLFGWQIPPTIDAYEVVPTIFHTYNPPYYHNYLKNSGFRTENGAVEYRVRFTDELAGRYRKFAAPPGVQLRPWDFSQLDRETARFAELLNDSFAKHWGAPPFPRSVMEGLTFGLRDFLVPEFCWFADVDGDPAGFVYSLPDLHQPPGTHGVLLIIGVRELHRGKGVNLALAARSYLAMIERGYKSASYTVVLDDNWPSRRTAEKLGCRVERNFAIYRRDWDVPDPASRR
jgi:GNAT superfamily N-acetyltransferase